MSLSGSFFDAMGQGEFSIHNLSLMAQSQSDSLADLKGQDDFSHLDSWLDRTLYFHELRHFHDFLGSPVGLHSFLEFSVGIEQVFVELGALTDDVSAPLCKYHPDISAVAVYDLYEMFLRIVLGDLKPDAYEEDVFTGVLPVRTFVAATPDIDTYYPLIPMPERDPLSGVFCEFLQPLGLRQIMEFTATEIQFFIASVTFDDSLQKRGEFLIDAMGTFVRRGFRKYTLIREFAQYCKLGSDVKGKIDDRLFVASTPPLGELMPYAQFALDLSGYVRVGAADEWVFEHPGQLVAHALARLTEINGEDSVQVLDQLCQEFIGTTYRSYFAKYHRQAQSDIGNVLPAHLRAEAAQIPLIAEVRKYAIATHLAIIRSKIDSPGWWTNPVSYVENLVSLPDPPLSIAGAKAASFASARTAGTFIMWSTVLAFLQGILHTGVVRCPIAERMPSLGSRVDFPGDGDGASTSCGPYLAARCCGTFQGAFMPGQPSHCPFAVAVATCMDLVGAGVTFEGVL